MVDILIPLSMVKINTCLSVYRFKVFTTSNLKYSTCFKIFTLAFCNLCFQKFTSHLYVILSKPLIFSVSYFIFGHLPLNSPEENIKKNSIYIQHDLDEIIHFIINFVCLLKWSFFAFQNTLNTHEISIHIFQGV